VISHLDPLPHVALRLPVLKKRVVPLLEPFLHQGNTVTVLMFLYGESVLSKKRISNENFACVFSKHVLARDTAVLYILSQLELKSYNLDC